VAALPPIKFAAPYIRAAIATLEGQMPEQVAQFNEQEENLVEIEAPATYHFGGTDLLSAFPWPQVEVAAIDGRFGAASYNYSERDYDPTINVVVWLEGVSGEIPELYEKALGIARCVIECLRPKDAFGPETELAEDGAIYWRGDVIPADPTDDNREFRRWRTPVFVQFRLEVVENFE
jgi:hypothetical protein